MTRQPRDRSAFVHGIAICAEWPKKTKRSAPIRTLTACFDGGAGEGTRTPDPIITNDVLYQLSYTGPVARRLACPMRDV